MLGATAGIELLKGSASANLGGIQYPNATVLLVARVALYHLCDVSEFHIRQLGLPAPFECPMAIIASIYTITPSPPRRRLRCRRDFRVVRS